MYLRKYRFLLYSTIFISLCFLFNFRTVYAEPVTFEKINIPSGYADVTEKYEGNSDFCVIHIQDAHCVYDAQKNINSILNSITSDNTVSLIAIEGAADNIDTTEFSTFPDSNVKKRVSDYMMKNGRISGVEYFSINKKNNTIITGLENRQLYLENSVQFKEILQNKSLTDQIFARLSNLQRLLENHLYPAQTKILLRQTEDYHKGRLQLTDYINYLFLYAAQRDINISDYPNLNSINLVNKIEQSIDFLSVDQERISLINAISAKMDSASMKTFLRKNMMFKLNQISQEEFHIYLSHLMHDYSIDEKNYPELSKFFSFIIKYDSINWKKVAEECELLNKRIVSIDINDPLKKSLIETGKHLNVTKKMFALSLPVYQFDDYLKNKDTLNPLTIYNQITKLASEFNIKTGFNKENDIKVLTKQLPVVESFYSTAKERDNVLINNLIHKIKKNNAQYAVFIAGGFHSEGITNYLREHNISYMVVVPRINEIPTNTPYLSLIMNQQSFYEIYLAKSTLAVASWLEQTPLISPERKTSLGYKMKSLMLGTFTYDVSKQEPDKIKADSEYLKNTVLSLLKNWGYKNYGAIEFTETSHIGPFLSVSLIINGKEVILLFTDKDEPGKATITTPENKNFEIVFNSSGELNLLEEDDLGDLHFQVITPQGLDVLNQHAEALNSKSAAELRKAVKEKMEERLTVLIMEKHMSGPNNLNTFLKENSIFLSDKELSDFFNSFGLYPFHLLSNTFSNNIANNTILGAYLAIKAKDEPLAISNKSLPEKAKNRFHAMGFNDLYVEQGIPVQIMKDLFRRLSFKDIDIESDANEFYIGADETGVYYLRTMKTIDGKLNLKVTRSVLQEPDISPKIDPTVIDEIIASTKIDQVESRILSIAPIRTSVAFAETSGDEMTISIIEVDENLKFLKTGLEVKINLKNNLSGLASAIAELQAKAIDNSLRILGITVDLPEIDKEFSFFSNIEDFMQYYQIRLIKNELVTRHTQQFPDDDITVNVLSNDLVGETDKILLISAMITTGQKSSLEFITEKLEPSAENYRFNIGLGDFLQDRFANLSETTKSITPTARFTVRHQGKVYELVKNAETGSIHMRLPNNAYSVPLTDGEIAFIKQSSTVFSKNSIEHTSPNVPTPSDKIKKTPILIDRWTTTSHAIDKKGLHDLTSEVAPFIANKLFDYEKYLKETFGLPITVFDLLGYQGIYTQQIFAKADEYGSELKFDPLIVTRDTFDASIAKGILQGLGYAKNRAIPAFSAGDQVSSIEQAITYLNKNTDRPSGIVPHVVSLVGSALELGVVSYEDAVNLVRDTWDVMPEGGLLFIAGSDYLTLQAQDFENIGFEILEMGNPQSFFDESETPKQYYILRKIASPQPKTLEQAAFNMEPQTPDESAPVAQLQLSPAEDVMDFFIKVSDSPIVFTSSTNGQNYTLKMSPKIKVQRPDGSTHMIDNLSNETIMASVDNKLYFELILTDGEASSLLPVLEGSLSMDLESLSISRIMLDSVNFGGDLKNMTDIGFTPIITRLFQELMPEGASIQQPLTLDYKTISAIYTILPVQNNPAVFDTVQEYIKQADALIAEEKSIEHILPDIYYHMPTLLADIKQALNNPTEREQINYNLRELYEESFIKDLLNAGFNNLSLSADDKGNLFIEGQKRQPIVNVVAKGNFRQNIHISSEKKLADQDIDRIRQKLFTVGEQLEVAHKVTEEYFRSMNFMFVDNLNTQYKISGDPSSIILDYSLFQEDTFNQDLLRLEVEQGLQRLELRQFNKVKSIANIPQSIQELFVLLNYVQSFIDIRQGNPDTEAGKIQQANILKTVNNHINPDERPIYKILQYVHGNNIKNAWAVRDILVDLITGQGDFAGNSVYPDNIKTELSNLDTDTVVREINRILELKEYWFAKDVITRSRTSKYTLNIRAHKELSIKEILSGNDIQVANLKIQNFKDVFNTFGAELGIAHALGDIGIFVVSRLLRETIEQTLAPLGVNTLVANNGGEFFISFSNVQDVNVTEILRNIIQDPEQKLQKAVIIESINALQDFLPEEKFTAIQQRIKEGFTPDKIHFYGGVSTHFTPSLSQGTNPDYILDSEIIQSSALTIDRLYKEAFQVAKHQQVQFSPKYNDIRAHSIAAKNRPETTERDLVNMFQPVVADSSKLLKSGIMEYSDELMEEVEENLGLGLLNEYQIFHPQIAPRYHSYANMERLSSNLQNAIENGENEEVLGELQDRLLETVVRYESKHLIDDYIYEGNENFKRVINYITSHKPDFPISVTFRVGGDEYGKVVWNEKEKTLQIFRFDGNNVGATNFEWGMEIGDKLIDESLRIISQTDDISKLQEAIDDFFNDMGDRGLVLSRSSLEMLEKKAPNLLILTEENYSLLKANGTFQKFTQNNSAVVIEKTDGSFVLVKYPDIHVPYPIQKSEHKFDKSKLPEDDAAPNALPISFLSYDEVFDFILVKDEKTAGLVLTSKNPRAPPVTKISYEDIENQTPISIPIEGRSPISISFKKDFRSDVIVKGDILTLNEKQFQKVKMSKNKLTLKNDKLAVMVTSRPVVSTGVLEIDTKKILPKYLNRNISVIQGRADSAAERAKEMVKLNQILQDKVVMEHTVASSNYKFSGSKKEMESFEEFEMSFFDMMTSAYILETPEQKLSRRLEYLMNPTRQLNPNDIFVLSRLYLESPDKLTDNQKIQLIRRMLNTYVATDSQETSSLILYTTIDILSSPDRNIWEPAVLALYNSSSDKAHAKKIAQLYLDSISIIEARTTDVNLLEKWKNKTPVDALEWYKSLIDRQKTDVLSEIYNLPYKSIQRLYNAKNKFLPIAAQYINMFESGDILQSKITDEQQQSHDEIVNLSDLTGYESVNELYEFAYSKITQALAPKTHWVDVEEDMKNELTRLIIGNGILEDTVNRIFEHPLNLGEINKLTIKRGPVTNIDNAYIVTLELEDGTIFPDIGINLLPPTKKIQPNNLKKYYASPAIKQYVENARILNDTNPALHPRSGNFYILHTDRDHFYKIVTSVDRPALTSKHVIDQAQKSFTGARLSQEIESTIKKDIIAYMTAWEALGRNKFFSAPYPDHILEGTEIRYLIFMDDNVNPGEMLNRFYDGYLEYEQWPVILTAIVEFFKENDPQKELAGFFFLAEAYSYLKDKDQPALTEQLELFLKQRIEILKLQVETHINLQNNIFAESLHLNRIFSPTDIRSTILNKALAYLERKALAEPDFTLNYSVFEEVIENISSLEQLHELAREKLEHDLMETFKAYGYDPMEELHASLVNLSFQDKGTASDESVAELISIIEKLEVVTGLKTKETFIKFNTDGQLFDIHPYALPVKRSEAKLEAMKYKDAKDIFQHYLEQHIASESGPFIVGISGRPDCGKTGLVQKFVQENNIIDRTDSVVLDLYEFRTHEGAIHTDLFLSEINRYKGKKAIFITGINVLSETELREQLGLDLTIFVESNEQTRIRHMLRRGDPKALSRIKLDNIFYRWGYNKLENAENFDPAGLDTQREHADLVVDMSDTHTQPVEEPVKQYSPETLIASLSPKLDEHLEAEIVTNINAIYEIFGNNTIGKQVAVFEPEHPAIPLILAQMGFQVIVLSEKKLDYDIDIETQYRMRKAGGTINNFWGSAKLDDTSWQKNRFDFVYLNNANDMLNPESIVYNQSRERTITFLINLLNDNGTILLKPGSLSDEFTTNLQQEPFNLAQAFSEALDKSSTIFLKKFQDVPDISDAYPQLTGSQQFVDRLKQMQTEQTEQTPTVITINFDDIITYSNQWDALIFVEALKRKINYFKSQNIPMQYAFISTKATVRNMRDYLGLKEHSVFANFLFVGAEDIRQLPDGKNKFDLIPKRLVELSGNPFSNIILMEARDTAGRHLPNQAIVLDISDILITGFDIEEILRIQSFLETTLLNNKIDPGLLVEEVSPDNPHFAQATAIPEQGMPIGNLAAGETLSFGQLKGMVIAAPKLQTKQKDLRRKLRHHELIERSM